MTMKQGREYRAIQDFSLVPRTEEKEEYRVRGTAVVFDTPTVLWEYDGVKYSEVIDRSAFDECDIYEDNVSGKLSDDRFAKMSRRYEDEQKEISEKIKTLCAEMDKLSSKSVTADMFISTVRKYTRAKVLTPRMLNELIDHIEVHQAEKIDGIWEQHLVIHYNCVGAIFIPNVFPLPAPQVSVNTRKGVVVNYAPGQLAV